MAPLQPVSTSDQRPSPEALLAAAAREEGGKLKVFLGAAPGVGKTFEMLQEGRRRKRETGIDVVVGVVETHGRKETELLLRGLEVIPRKRVPYKGSILEEMDLDAVLARRPALAMVDELAHTNAQGSRHPKRYLDVEELLAAGIDVYSTLNIQHLESLNDVVARITRIRVRETVPDSVLDIADAVEVVDTTPDELIQRLRDGKVYVRDQAQRALKHYFSPGNLTALRELALRRTAEQVDEQMLSYMRAHGISGPWEAGERLLVCIDETPDAAKLVRFGKRAADRRRAPWTVLYVETVRHLQLTDQERGRITETLRLAEQLGGEALTLPGERIADEVFAFARDNNITQIVVAKSPRSHWFELMHGSVVRDLVKKASGITIHVIPSEGESRPTPRRKVFRKREPFRLVPYLVSTLLVGGALLAGELIEQFVEPQNISLVFLSAVLFSAVFYGRWPSTYAAILSVIAYNFFFFTPLFTFTVADPDNVIALIFFLLVAMATSNLAARARAQTISARRQARRTASLFAFSRKLVGIADLDDLLWATAYQIAAMLKVEVVFLMPDEAGTLVVRAGFPPEDRLDEADLAAAHWAWKHNRPAGRGSDTLPGAKRLFLPLRTDRGPVAVLGIHREEPTLLLDPDERRLLDALTDQAVVAIERTSFAETIEEARVAAETDRLRAALLASVSHDLRTPLAGILGSVTSVRSYWSLYDETTRDEMLLTIQEEAERLNRFVANLLDMTRLDSGALNLKREMLDFADLVGTALHRTSGVLANHRVEVDLASDLPMLNLDFVLTEQVLVNLLDNAAKYIPHGATIEIRARRDQDKVMIEVLDDGPGIPPGECEHIFEKFYRLPVGDQPRPGTGLGLAICRGLVEAQGGLITAQNRADRRGAVFTLVFPAGTAARAADAKTSADDQ